MKITRQLDETVWREFVTNHPQAQIFHTQEMFQVFSRTKGYEPGLWATLDTRDRPLALLLPVQITLMNGLFQYFTSRAVAYGSVLCQPKNEGLQALQVLLSTYQKAMGKSLLFTELRNLTDVENLQPILNKNGFIYEDHLNYILDLARPLDELWAGIRSNARRNIRQAQKLGVIIERVDNPEQILSIYGVLQNVYQRIRVPLADISFFQAALEILYPKKMMEIFVAKVNGIDIGVLTLLLHKEVAIYWYTGVLREYGHYRANDLLVWHILEWAHQNGFQTLDFGGAGKPDVPYGVRDFKAKFGGDLVNYGRNICIHTPTTLKISKSLYQVGRRILYGRNVL